MALFLAGLGYLAGNLYLSVWLLRWLAAWSWPFTAPAAGAAVLAVFWLWAASPVWAFLARKGPLRRALRRACGMWLAFMLYGFVLAGAFAALRQLALRWPGYTALPVAARARLLAGAGSLALAIDLALCLWGRWRAERLRVRRRAVSVAKSCETPRLRVALVADLHLGSNLGLAGLRRLCAAIRAEKPDLVCIAGDLFDNCFDDIEQPDEAARLLAGLRPRWGVWACWGNHDLPEELLAGFTVGRPKQDGRFEAFIQQAGIRMLCEETARLGCGVQLAGRADRGMARRAHLRRAAPAQMLAGLDKAAPIFVLDHQPREDRALADAGADLVLCGHTHDGQLWPANWLMRLLWHNPGGVRRRGGAWLATTSGAGVWGPPMRVGTRSEVLVLDVTFAPCPEGENTIE